MQGVRASPAASTATREEAKVSTPIAAMGPGIGSARTTPRAVRISATTWSASMVLVPSSATVKECRTLCFAPPTSRAPAS